MNIRIVLAIVFSLTGFPVYAAGVVLGPLCLDGVRATPHPENKTEVSDGTWIPTDYNLASHDAKIAVFDRSIPPSSMHETCAEVMRRMKSAGAKTIVDGSLKSFHLRALLFRGMGSSAKIQVDKGALQATLSNVTSGSRPLAGGEVSFVGSRLWISNADTLFSTADDIRGTLSIEAWNRPISGVHVSLPGGLEYIVDLRPRGSGNLTVALDLADGHAILTRGELVGTPHPLSPGALQLTGLQTSKTDLRASNLSVSASDLKTTIEFLELGAQADEIVVQGKALKWTFAQGKLRAASLRGDAVQTPAKFALVDADMSNVNVDSDGGSLGSETTVLFSGAVQAAMRVVSKGDLEVNSTWTTVSSPALPTIFHEGVIKNLSLLLKNGQHEPNLSGKILPDEIALLGIDLKQNLQLTIQNAAVSSVIQIPVHIATPPAKGEVTVSDGGNVVVLRGSLESLFLNGTISIPLDAIETSHLDVKKGDFHFGMGAAVCISPLIAGAKPNFAGTTLQFTNYTDLSVGRTSSGVMLASANVFVLGQPIIKVGEGGTARPASFDITAEGGAKLFYDLFEGKTVVAQAKLAIHDFDFHLLGDEPRTIDIGGNIVKDPSVTLQTLSLQIDQLSDVKIQQASFERLSIGASHVERRRVPGSEDGLAYDGEFARPLTVAQANALKVEFSDILSFSDFQLAGVDLGVRSANVDLSKGTAFPNASLDLGLTSARQITIGDHSVTFFSGGRLDVRGELSLSTPEASLNNRVGTRLRLENVEGLETGLSGTGSLDIGGFTGNARGDMKITFACAGSDHLGVPMEYNFAVAGVSAQAHMLEGKLRADGAVGPLLLIMHTVSGAECSSEVTKHVIQKQGEWWTDGICNRGWEIYHCRWESPEISYSYHIHLAVRFANVNLGMTNPHVYYDDGHMSYCNMGAMVLAPGPVLGGYSPGIDSPYPGLDAIVNGIIEASLEPAQSVIATSLTSGLGFLFNQLAPAGNLFCVGKPI